MGGGDLWFRGVLVLAISACSASEVVPQRWDLVQETRPDDRVVAVSVVGEVCDGINLSSESVRTDVEETATTITIKVWLRNTRPRIGGCTAAGQSIFTQVELAEPIGNRSIQDGS